LAFDWTAVEVVLDIAQEAVSIPHGVLLVGEGTLHVGDIRLETVEADVPTTGRPMPSAGWMVSGTRLDAYELAIVEDAQKPRPRAAVLRTVADPGDGGGTVAQIIHADSYRGKTVSFGASLEGIQGDASSYIWLRVGRNSEQLALLNEPDPPLQGVFEAHGLKAVLPVAPDATVVAFGVSLQGTGAVRITDACFDVVGEEGFAHQPWPKGPDDLDFEGAPRPLEPAPQRERRLSAALARPR
jgi:hypothetical protein